MANNNLIFTLWDVGHGISIWINTPNGSNHWIDLGRTSGFSPCQYVRWTYGIEDIDYLIISHPDKDHLEDLPQFKSVFGYPKAVLRNISLPAEDIYGQGTLEYQQAYADLNQWLHRDISWSENPANPVNNGSIRHSPGFSP